MTAGGRRSLRQVLGWRLAGAGLVSLSMLLLVLGTVYTVQRERLEQRWLHDAAAHFERQTRRMDEDWLRQAELLRAQIEFSGVLDGTDPQLSAARLTAFLANLGGQGTFTHVEVRDAAGTPWVAYGTRSGGPPPAPGHGPRSWVHSATDGLVYRVIRSRLHLGSQGHGELLLYVPVNNATLGAIAFPSARLSLHWQNAPDLAYSDALVDSPAAASTPGEPLIESFFPWAATPGTAGRTAEDTGPELHVYRRSQQVLPLTELLLLTVGIVAGGAFFAWLVIGRWARQHVRHIDTLSGAVAGFAEGRHDASTLGAELVAGTRDADLELRRLGQGLASMMQAAETADADKTAAHQRLAELNATLEQRVEQRTRELAEARDDALAAARTRQQILAGVSHELRNPLVGLMGSLELVDLGSLPPAQRKLVEVASRSGQALRNVIDDVLDYSRLEAVGAQLRQLPFHLGELVTEAAALHAAVALNKGLRLECHVAPQAARRVLGDPVRLRQVLLNLLGNALKFTDRGEVELRLGLAALPHQAHELAVRFEVYDTGIGIDATAQAGLFSPFVQADAASTRPRGGTGLGLAIAQRLVAAMGGRINLLSAVDEGSVFWFELVFPQVDDDAPPDSLPAPMSLRSARRAQVLLVEDEPVNRIIVTEMLRRLGLDVTEAENGLLAIESLRRQPVDLVLMDQQMPILDGLAATARIRAGDAGTTMAKVPIVAVTANAQTGDAERCLAAGMDDYLAKPFTQVELARKVEHWLAREPAAPAA